MIKSIVSFAALAISVVASALTEVGPRQQETDLSGFVGQWYVAGASANMTDLWNNMTQTIGFACACPRLNITLCPGDSALQVDSVCDLQNTTTSTIAGNVTTAGVMVLERQVDIDEYLLRYSVHNTTVIINSVPFNRTMGTEYTTEVQSKILHVPSCPNGNCTSQGQPAGFLSWSTSEPIGYKALMSSNATLNETGYNDLVNAAGPEDAEGLVRLNTTCNNISV